MDLERSLFKSYEASLFSCMHSPPGRKCGANRVLFGVQVCAGMLCVLVAVFTALFHDAFFVRHNALADAVMLAKYELDAALTNTTVNTSVPCVFPEDMVVYIALRAPTAPEYVLAFSDDVGRLPEAVLHERGFPTCASPLTIAVLCLNLWRLHACSAFSARRMTVTVSNLTCAHYFTSPSLVRLCNLVRTRFLQAAVMFTSLSAVLVRACRFQSTH